MLKEEHDYISEKEDAMKMMMEVMMRIMMTVMTMDEERKRGRRQ